MRSLKAALFVLAALAVTGPVRASDASDDAAKEIEMQIDEAREQLDQAARTLAELHTRMWSIETTGARAERPLLGILLHDSGTADGLTLAGVTPEGGAEQAGIEGGDRIVEVNGMRLDEGGDSKPMYRLGEAMAEVRAGDVVSVTFVRNGASQQVEVLTQARGKYMASLIEEKQPWLDSLRSLEELEDLAALKDLEELEMLGSDSAAKEAGVVRIPAGLRLEDVQGDLARYFDVDAGVLVLQSRVADSAIRPGDILLALGDDAVTGADAALKQLAGLQGTIKARVKRQGESRDIDLDVDALNAEQAIQIERGDRRIVIHRAGDGNQVEIVVDD
jgi:S1-C subfamily serine protease